MSGANSTPLGRMNPAIGGGKKIAASLLNPSYLDGLGPSPQPLGITAVPHSSSNKRESDSDSYKAESLAERKRRRKSRWQGSEKEKTFIPGMPTVLPSNMNKDQEEAYLLQLQIEELSRRLRSNDLGIPPNPEDRSPSPEPIYNNEGKRLNTREYRTRKKLEDDRHAVIQLMFKLNPEYKPPADYKPPVVKVSDKVMIPQEEHPDINFVGLLIGPRGNTLKSMEKDTGAKIIIRGKGSVKEGKVGRKDGGPMPGEDEPLHAYVTASNPEAVKKAVDRIKEIIRQGVEVPEGQNDLRRMQLRELALLNGTLRETDGPRCSNCGATTHKSWQCPDKPNITNNVVCTSCGGAGHIAKDCRGRKPGMMSNEPPIPMQKNMDEEYMSLMAELGEGSPPPSVKNGNGGGGSRPQIRSLLDTPVAPPRAILGGPQMNQMNRPNSLMNMNTNMPMNNMGSMSGGPGGNNMNQMGGNNMSNMNNNMNSGGGGGGGGGGNSNNMRSGNGWGNSGGGNNNPNSQQYNHRTNRPILGSGPQQAGFNRPPPMGWQGGQNQQQSNFQEGPPPNLLSAPPPPPPPSSQNSNSNSNNQQQSNQWMNQGGPPPGMGQQWQGPPGMGCPAPGPVPPPRPVGPPPNWGWGGPGPQPVGAPPGNANRGGNNNNSAVDLGALLSAPPPPPPSS